MAKHWLDGWMVHDSSSCEGEHCAIHNPSDHHMKDWPRLMRETGLVERICKCGVGHPDPDSQAYLTKVTGDSTWGIHGCCGCCYK